ncbi:Dap1 protein [Martiniozyma asiatica (nom. inval.)]|nr:Dap1 protein [Martiniozyma asiatica]
MDSAILIAIIALLVLYLLKTILLSSPNVSNLETQIDPEQSDTILYKKYTPRELSRFNGFDDPLIFIAVKGKVYNVSKGRRFYGPSGPYSNFAGHDASRGLALNSFEMDIIKRWDEPIDDLEGLTDKEWEALDGWERMFKNKYALVGELVCDPLFENVASGKSTGIEG